MTSEDYVTVKYVAMGKALSRLQLMEYALEEAEDNKKKASDEYEDTKLAYEMARSVNHKGGS